MEASHAPRRRNARGSGSRLRDDILNAALQLLDHGGAVTLTLRAVARQAGIAAPSIYPHFSDLDTLVAAVSDRCFEDLTRTVSEHRDRHTDSVERLVAACAAYLDYAAQWPQRYALLFRANAPGFAAAVAGSPASMAAFEELLKAVTDCLGQAGRTSSEAFASATTIWCGLDGYANLSAHRVRFSWPDREELLRLIIGPVVHTGRTELHLDTSATEDGPEYGRLDCLSPRS